MYDDPLIPPPLLLPPERVLHQFSRSTLQLYSAYVATTKHVGRTQVRLHGHHKSTPYRVVAPAATELPSPRRCPDAGSILRTCGMAPQVGTTYRNVEEYLIALEKRQAEEKAPPAAVFMLGSVEMLLRTYADHPWLTRVRCELPTRPLGPGGEEEPVRATLLRRPG